MNADEAKPFWIRHPSKVTADRVAAELHAIGWKTEVVPVNGKFEVRYWDRSEHHRKDEQ